MTTERDSLFLISHLALLPPPLLYAPSIPSAACPPPSPLLHVLSRQVHNICYSNVARPDSKTTHLRALAHEWRNIADKSAAEAAALILSDRVDILVDLTGHTSGNRLDVMALKPAPVQATWIGYPNSTGLPTIDYRFTDAVADPVDTPQRYTETLVRLPGPFLCYTPPVHAPHVTPTPALVNGYVTFGSFNNLAKVTDQVLALWATALRAVPRSRLLLKCKPFASETIREKTIARLERLGISSRRVDCMPLTPTTGDHLSAYSMVRDVTLLYP